MNHLCVIFGFLIGFYYTHNSVFYGKNDNFSQAAAYLWIVFENIQIRSARFTLFIKHTDVCHIQIYAHFPLPVWFCVVVGYISFTFINCFH